MVTALSERFGVAHNPHITFVTGVADHTNALGLGASRGLEASGELGQFPGQRMPKGVAVTLARIFQKIGVEFSRKRAGGRFLAVKTAIIRVNIQQGHAAMPSDPIELLKPDVGGALAEQEKEGGIL